MGYGCNLFDIIIAYFAPLKASNILTEASNPQVVFGTAPESSHIQILFWPVMLNLTLPD